VFGLLIHAVAVADARGRLAMRVANGVQFVGLAIVPAAAVWLAPTVGGALAASGIAWAALGGTVVLRRGTGRWRGEVSQAASALLRFGLPRVPGDAALMGLLALPAVVASHRFGVIVAGHLAFAITVGSALGSLMAPLGTVFLPVASARVARGEWVEVRRGARRLLGLGLAVVVPLSVVVFVIAPVVVRLILGVGFDAAVPLVRIVTMAGVGFAIYVLLRNLLEASVTTALNTRNLLMALAVFGVGALWAATPTELAGAVAGGFIALAAGTAWAAQRVLAGSRGEVGVP